MDSDVVCEDRSELQQRRFGMVEVEFRELGELVHTLLGETLSQSVED